jgi:PAS domain S-box-containing protein
MAPRIGHDRNPCTHWYTICSVNRYSRTYVSRMLSMKRDRYRSNAHVTPMALMLLSLLGICVHEVFERLLSPLLPGGLLYIVTLFASLAIVAAAAHYIMRQLHQENEESDGVNEAQRKETAERRRQEEKLRESECRYRTIFETIGVPVLIIEEDTTISLVNTEFEKLSGFSRREIEGQKCWTEFVAADELERMRTYHAERRTQPGSVPKTYKAQFVDRGGRVRDMLFTVDIVPGTKKSVGCTIDISELKITESALRESEERYRTAIECSNDAVTIVQGDVRVYANQKFLEIFGYDRMEDVIGRPTFHVIHPDDRDCVTEFNRLRQSGEPAPSRYEFKGIRKDGTIVHMEVSAAKVTYRGQPAALGYMRDITERRQAEEQIKTSLKEKEVLIKEIHHRVKNNLQVVSSLLFLQSQTVKDEETRRILEESRNRVKSMAFIHKQLYQSKNLAHIDFASYVRSLTKNLLTSYRTNGNDISLDVRVDDIFLALDSAIPCGLIINELVSNTLKHAFSNHSAGHITVDLHQEGEKNVLVVSDNGVGLPVGLDVHTTETLGLQLVSALVQQLDGTLELERGSGTVFKISF